MTAKEIEKIIKGDGWYLCNIIGSHHHYKHPIKQGKVTIPFHGGDIKKARLKVLRSKRGLSKEAV